MAKSYFLPQSKFKQLFDALQAGSDALVGPMVKDGAVSYQKIESSDLLPWGVVDEQLPGQYTQSKTGDHNKAFAWTVAANSAKPMTFAPQESLWKVGRGTDGKLAFLQVLPKSEKVVLFGVKPCDVHALSIQDNVFIHGEHEDQRYKIRRENLFIVTVNCMTSGRSCFCTSVGGSPKAESGYQIALTELNDGYLLTSESAWGDQLVVDLQLDEAETARLQEADNAFASVTESVSKNKIPDASTLHTMMDKLDHPQWDDIADRCLSCGNCTQTCPTCFCHSEADHNAISGNTSEHTRQWDSCFSAEHSYFAGETVRDTTKKRYRQWLTHKFATWQDQFNEVGCVGCGRCITWCPVGIDIIQELAVITSDKQGAQ